MNKLILIAVLSLFNAQLLAACAIEPPPPPQVGAPQWLSDTQPGTWTMVGNPWSDVDPLVQFPDWDLGSRSSHHTAVIENWNGMVARDDYLVSFAAGGHMGSPQNAVFEFGPFNSESPEWHWYGTDQTKYPVPSHKGGSDETIADWTAEYNKDYYSDGLPSASHTYDHVAYCRGTKTVYVPYGKGFAANPTDSSVMKSFVFTSELDVGGYYEPQNTHPDMPGGRAGPGGGAACDPTTGIIWVSQVNGPDRFYSYNTDTKEWLTRSTFNPNGGDTDGYALDYDRKFVALNNKYNSTLTLYDISAGREGEAVAISSNYSGPLLTARDIGFVYEPVGQVFVGYAGGAALYTLEPPADYRLADGSLNPDAVWTWQTVTNGAGGITPSAQGKWGTYGRLAYIASIRALAVINNPSDQGVYVYRIPEGGM